jgi:hypothetical protein
MTRAVAENGVELMEGPHQNGLGEEVITIKQANGLVREVPFDEDDGATPVLIEAMILDLKIEDSELRETTKEHCLNWLKGWLEVVGDPEDAYSIPLSEVYTRAETFIAGYKAAIQKLQPYWRNPSPAS